MSHIDLDLDSLDMSPVEQPDPNAATDKQVAFFDRLMAERSQPGLSREHAVTLMTLRNLRNDGGLNSKRAMSKAIDLLLSLPRAPKPNAVSEAGMFRKDGVIYKVQRAIHGSGNLYAKRLNLFEPDCGGCQNGDLCDPPCEWGVEFVYAPGVISQLSEDDRMSLSEAKEFGALYGTCVVCGRTLTNESSIEAGIGPVCATKF